MARYAVNNNNMLNLMIGEAYIVFFLCIRMLPEQCESHSGQKSTLFSLAFNF